MSASRDATALERAIAHRFADPALFARALSHPSLAAAGGGGSYERLEFLGDRVLGLVVAEMLFERFAAENEGLLARRHAALVRRETLAHIARAIGLPEALRLSPAEEQAGGRDNDATLADGCEALIAALYLDGGLEAARAFVRARWSALMEDAAREPPKDPKTALQEWAQARGLGVPAYQEMAREGPAHAPRFRIVVRVRDLGEAEGRGPTKRAAEQAAAEALFGRTRP